jgi:hypothetical protein
MTVTALADWSVAVGTVVGLTTTELPAPWFVGFDGGGTVTEMTGNSTGCAGAVCCASCA